MLVSGVRSSWAMSTTMERRSFSTCSKLSAIWLKEWARRPTSSRDAVSTRAL